VFVPAIAKRAISYGSRAWLATLAGLVNVRLDQLVLIPLVSARELGLYAVAVNVNTLLSPLSGAIATVATTRVAREGSASSSASIGRHAVFLLTLLVLVLGVTVPFLLPLVFGADFHDAVVLAEILVPGTLALSVAAVVGSIAAGLGAPGISSAGEIGALAITMVGLAVLVPLGGAIAAAAVSTAAYTVNLAVQVILLRRKLRISVSDLLMPRWSDLPALTSMLRQAVRR
jgi:O-antigen/teichoic acid export membrane protein